MLAPAGRAVHAAEADTESPDPAADVEGLESGDVVPVGVDGVMTHLVWAMFGTADASDYGLPAPRRRSTRLPHFW